MVSRYGHQHQKVRAALLPHAYGSPCARCKEKIQPGEAVDLDHAGGGGYLGFSHAACNRAAGARKVNAMRKGIPADAPCAFGFRASADIWRRFFRDPPEPLYHDVFAMLMRVPGFVLEGDTLIAMQHARALHRTMKVMRMVSPHE